MVSGYEKEISLIENSLLFSNGAFPQKSIILIGPNGCGKTLFVESIRKILMFRNPWVQLIRVSTDSQLNNVPRSTRCIVTIDPVSKVSTKALIDYFDQRLDTSVVIGTCVNTDRLGPLRQADRFEIEVEIGVPSTQDRICLLERYWSALITDESQRFDFLQATHGFTCSDIICAINRTLRLPGGGTADTLIQTVRSVRPSSLRDIIPNKPFNTKWSDIAGCEVLKRQLLHMLVWPFRHPEAFDRMGIRAPNGILLYGPPGCSKTMIARAIATESGLNFFSIKGPEVFSKWVGDSEKAIRHLFERARMAAPSIVFFDEIDAIAVERCSDGSRSDSSGVGNRVLAQLLTEMDGLETDANQCRVMVVAATNRPDVIDAALLRPGRFDRLVYVPMPDKDTRKRIFELHLTKMVTDPGVLCPSSLSLLVDLTKGYSGAEIVAVCREAAINALDNHENSQSGANIKQNANVEMRHFEEALRMVHPRTDPAFLEKFNKFSQ